MRAKDILALLATRHSKDVFVPECKNGPTHYSKEMLRLDGWAMERSWKHPIVHGYEIKVSRSDFLADKKFHRYLPLCTNFWFAVAPGVCDPSEVPENCGLVVASTNGTRLFTKRKAPYRDVTIPLEVYRYVLMCRAEITDEHSTPSDNTDYWRRWLAEKEEDRDIGHRVAKALSDKYSRDVTKVQTENHRLNRTIEKYKDIAALCEKLDIHPGQWMREQDVKDKIAAHGKRVSAKAVRLAKSICDEAGELVAALDRSNDTEGEELI